MTFSRRYLLWLFLPPAIITIPLAVAFLTHVIQLSWESTSILIALILAVYGIVALVFSRAVSPRTEQLVDAVAQGGDLSKLMSSCLHHTASTALRAWSIATVALAVAGTLIFLRTPIASGYFVVGSLITCFPAMLWSYAAGKRQLLDFAGDVGALRYSGREFSLGRKIAIVFIGTFIVSSLALVQLISSKVATTLENLAISSSSDRFERLRESASVMKQVGQKELDTLRDYVPSDYSIHIIRPDGKLLSTKEPLTGAEVQAIRQMRNGDTSSFISPHVGRFAELADHSIIFLSVPWAPYKNIPLQITFYTMLISLVTTAMFMIATYFLSRDITAPVQKLRDLAAELAQGHFDVEARVFSDDEIGKLADSFSETQNNLRRLLGRVGGSGSTITEGVRVIIGGTESLLVRSRSQAELTESSSLAVENVRGGIGSVLGAAETVTELTHDASSRSLEMQASAEEVARSMDYLFQSVEKTSSSTTEMDAAMRSMSERTDVLAGIGDEVLSFVSQMDSTIEELRATAQSTASISRQVSEDAEVGGTAVGKTVAGINQSRELSNSTADVLDELQRSVGQINQILTVIEEITGRTNLLALNAAIIAAQAGEHGLGFTVVADEIRELAERTRGSTKEIGAIIKAVQSGSRQAVAKMHEGVALVAENVELAENAASSLTKIVASAGRSYEMATMISRALEEQAQASRHLHDVTSRMSDHITEMNRGTREQARGTQLLAQESERVREIAGQVRTATDEQSIAGRGITMALEKIAEDAGAMRDLLEGQLKETDSIADASRTMLEIAQANDAIAREFDGTVQSLVQSGRDFDNEVSKFRFRS